jgi:hypothetical protein
LQRQYGNRYVERVLALAREQPGDDHVDGKVENAIQEKRGGGHSLNKGVRGQMEGALGGKAILDGKHEKTVKTVDRRERVV